MAERALVLSADQWQMPDEKTGEIIKGTSIWFLNSYRESSEGAVGFKPTKVSGSFDMFHEMSKAQLPALCELEFGSRPGAAGKATLTLIGIKPIKSVDLFGAGKS